jgi:hypothetical protein
LEQEKERLKQEEQLYLEGQCDLDGRLYSVNFLMHFKESFTAKPENWNDAISCVTKDSEKREKQEKEARRTVRERARAEKDQKRLVASGGQSTKTESENGATAQGRVDNGKDRNNNNDANTNCSSSTSNNNKSSSDVWRPPSKLENASANMHGQSHRLNPRPSRNEREPKMRRDKPEKTEEEQFESNVRILLSKLTLMNFAKICNDMQAVFKSVRRGSQIETIARLIFERAIGGMKVFMLFILFVVMFISYLIAWISFSHPVERKFVEAYARLCRELDPHSPSVTVDGIKSDFRTALLNRTQIYFENKVRPHVIPGMTVFFLLCLFLFVLDFAIATFQ